MTRIAITAGPTAGSKRRAATHYGARAIEDVLPAQYTTAQGKEVQEIVFSFDDLPVSGLDAAIQRIAGDARISEATVTVLSAMTGTTGTLTIGLEEEDGTVIDADGIDAAIAQAALVAGARIVCDGALIGTTIGAAAGQVVITTGGTVTGGKFVLRVEYEPENDRANS